jgi:hypothetical protein
VSRRVVTFTVTFDDRDSEIFAESWPSAVQNVLRNLEGVVRVERGETSRNATTPEQLDVECRRLIVDLRSTGSGTVDHLTAYQIDVVRAKARNWATAHGTRVTTKKSPDGSAVTVTVVGDKPTDAIS